MPTNKKIRKDFIKLLIDNNSKIHESSSDALRDLAISGTMKKIKTLLKQLKIYRILEVIK